MRDVRGQHLKDNWPPDLCGWQTETGAIMNANTSALDSRAGAMGRPVPGIDAAIVQRLRGGGIQLLDQTNAVGELALRAGWPSMFRAYLGDIERYRQYFISGWYLSGDLAKQDDDGYLWFIGRSDDVIKSSGHLIGPFEVENVLIEHPAVAEVGGHWETRSAGIGARQGLCNPQGERPSRTGAATRAACACSQLTWCGGRPQRAKVSGQHSQDPFR